MLETIGTRTCAQFQSFEGLRRVETVRVFANHCIAFSVQWIGVSIDASIALQYFIHASLPFTGSSCPRHSSLHAEEHNLQPFHFANQTASEVHSNRKQEGCEATDGMSQPQ